MEMRETNFVVLTEAGRKVSSSFVDTASAQLQVLMTQMRIIQ